MAALRNIVIPHDIILEENLASDHFTIVDAVKINACFALKVRGTTITILGRADAGGIQFRKADAVQASKLMRTFDPEKIYEIDSVYDKVKRLQEETIPDIGLGASILQDVTGIYIYIFFSPVDSKNFYTTMYTEMDPATGVMDLPENKRISYLVMYYVAAFCTIFTNFSTFVITSEITEKSSIMVLPSHFDAPEAPQGNQINTLITEAFLFVAYAAKNIQSVQNITMDWFSRRVTAMFKGRTRPGGQRAASIALIKTFWTRSTAFRKIIVTYLTEPTLLQGEFPYKEKISQFVGQCRMIMQFAGMKLLHQSYIYVKARPQLLLEPIFLEQAHRLKTNYERLRQEHGAKFPYLRLLEDSVPDLDIINYTDVAYATIAYNKTVSPTWENFAEIKHPNQISRNILEDKCTLFMQDVEGGIPDFTPDQLDKLQEFGITEDAIDRARRMAERDPDMMPYPRRGQPRRQ